VTFNFIRLCSRPSLIERAIFKSCSLGFSAVCQGDCPFEIKAICCCVKNSLFASLSGTTNVPSFSESTASLN
jgi:hypothetical protein